jgi:hypothetical protein
MRNPFILESEAKNEVYIFIDKFYKKLPKNEDGSIREFGSDFSDNDIDAFRHSYVSGVFTQEYGERAAEIFGNLRELISSDNYSSSNNPKSKNMDLWNNAVGRKYGKKTSSRKKLFKFLLEAIKKGELIIDPDLDKRIYQGKTPNLENLKDQVIVIKETKKGKNILYFDFANQIFLTRDDFVSKIKIGDYPKYEIRIVDGIEVPVSKKDSTITNNLG